MSMTRQNVYADTFDSGPRVVGWFDRAKAERLPEGTRWDGSNHVSLATGSQWTHETLWHTAAGRWVLQRSSDIDGDRERWTYAGDDEARAWLVTNDYPADDVERLTRKALPDEAPAVGRPEVGPQVKVCLPKDTIAKIDAAAGAVGLNRSAWIRQQLEAVVR